MIEDRDLLDGISQVTQSRIVLSGALNDLSKVEELRRMTPESARQVLTAYGSLGASWDQAIKGAEYRAKHEPEHDIVCTEKDIDGNSPQIAPVRRVHRVPLSSLRPNRWNADLFPDSLANESLEDLRDSVLEVQAEPIHATDEGVIVNGERRWRALGLAGHTHCDVEYVGVLSDDAILDKVLDFMVTTRKPTLLEKTRVYLTLVKRLQATRGRKQGRPKTSPDGEVLSPKEIRELAARKAGISSVRQAERLEAIFTRGTKPLQDEVNAGTIAIEDAFAATPKLRFREEKRVESASQPPSENAEGVDTSVDSNTAPPPKATRATSARISRVPRKFNNTDAGTAADGHATPSPKEATLRAEPDTSDANRTMVDLRDVLALFDGPLLDPGMRVNPFEESPLDEVESNIQALRTQVQDQRQLLEDIAECLGCDRVDGMLLEEIGALRVAASQ